MKQFRKIRPFLLLLCVALVFILAFSGYYRDFDTEDIGFFNMLFSIIRMFVLGASTPESLNWQLLLAKYLAAVLVGYGIFVSIYNYLHSKWVVLRIKYSYRKHTIIFGIGKLGYRIANELLMAGKKVVAIEKNLQNDNIWKVKRKGGMIITGNAFERENLINAGIANAQNCLIITGNDENNLRIANLLFHLHKQHVISHNFKAYIHIDDWYNNNFLRNYLDLYNKTPNFVISTFNIDLATAQLVYDDFPPLQDVDYNNPEKENAIAVIGYTQATELFIVENIILSHGPGLKNLKIYVFDKNIDNHIKQLYFKYPFLDDYIDIIPVELTDENFYDKRYSSVEFSDKLTKIIAAYIFGENDAYLMGLANSFRQLLYATINDLRKVPIVVCLPEKSNVLDLLHPNKDKPQCKQIPLFITLKEHFNINVVRMSTDTCTKAKLIDKSETVDALAMIINYFYAVKYEFLWLFDQKKREKIIAAKGIEQLESIFLHIRFETRHPVQELEAKILSRLSEIVSLSETDLRNRFGIQAAWDRLPDIKQDSNRYVARHIPVKVNFLKKMGQNDLQKQDIEKYFKLLAPIEHKRWMSEKLVYKFRYGAFPEKDKKLKSLLKDTLKIHDQIIPYNDLDKEMEDKDFNMFLLIPVLEQIREKH